MTLQLFPIELHGEICKYLTYEEVKVYSEALELPVDKIILCLTKIESSNVYVPNIAHKIKLFQLNKGIIKVSDSILILIESPEDFNILSEFKNLKHANFILPHNKYESINEFEKYLNSFFDVLVFRKTNLKINQLTFRLLYSSDYNPYLGIVMHKGFIELINAENFVGFNSEDDGHMNDLDFLVDIARSKIPKNVPIFYGVGSGGFTYLQENDLYSEYLDCGIIPTFMLVTDNVNKDKRKSRLQRDLDEYKNVLGIDHPTLENISLDDYLVILTSYRDGGISRNDGFNLKKLFQLALEENPHIFKDSPSSSSWEKLSFIILTKLPKCLEYISGLLSSYSLIYIHDNKLKTDFIVYSYEQLLTLTDSSSLNGIMEVLLMYDSADPQKMPNYMYHKVLDKKFNYNLEKKSNDQVCTVSTVSTVSTVVNPYHIDNLSDEDTIEWNVTDSDDE